MRYIQLTKEKSAIVDDEDFEWLNQWKWTADKGYKTWYAVRSIKKDGKWTHVRMHVVILAGCDRVDHKDGNGLNNQKENLRPATHRQNLVNSSRLPGESGLVGVDFINPKWRARITIDGVNHHIGMFDSKEQAARAYDDCAKKFNAEFARTNFR
jgi:hypothetical protein